VTNRVYTIIMIGGWVDPVQQDGPRWVYHGRIVLYIYDINHVTLVGHEV